MRQAQGIDVARPPENLDEEQSAHEGGWDKNRIGDVGGGEQNNSGPHGLGTGTEERLKSQIEEALQHELLEQGPEGVSEGMGPHGIGAIKHAQRPGGPAGEHYGSGCERGDRDGDQGASETWASQAKFPRGPPLRHHAGNDPHGSRIGKDRLGSAGSPKGGFEDDVSDYELRPCPTAGHERILTEEVTALSDGNAGSAASLDVGGLAAQRPTTTTVCCVLWLGALPAGREPGSE